MKSNKIKSTGFGLAGMILCLLISSCVKIQTRPGVVAASPQYDAGAIIRADQTSRKISLVFTGDSYGDGGEVIRRILAEQNVVASFFLTGNFYRNPEFRSIIEGLKKDGHYLGAHSDRHLLYCSWEKRDSLLVSREQFLEDLQNNYYEMAKFGIAKEYAPYFLPPYEWYNQQVSEWTSEFGAHLINYTPGTRSHADYTTPDMGRRYVTTDSILVSIKRYEQNEKNGLNGFILLMHIGTHPDRVDKLYNRLDELIVYLKSRDLHMVRIDELLNTPSY